MSDNKSKKMPGILARLRMVAVSYTHLPQNPIRMFLLYMQIMKRRLLPYWKIICIRAMNMRLLLRET